MQEKDSIVSQEKIIQEDFCGPICGFSEEINSTKDRLFGPLCILEYDCFLN